jgi:hypothetical protein
MSSTSIGDLPDPGYRGARYSQQPLPPYRYVPGRHPHPTRDAAGHSHGTRRHRARHGPWDPDDWPRFDDWLAGVDLFNHFYFWEAHEAWEGLWATAPRGSAAALLLQGLIQISAALLKVHLRNAAGARRLSTAGVHKLQCAAVQRASLLGLAPGAVATECIRYFAPLQAGILPEVDERVPLLSLV